MLEKNGGELSAKQELLNKFRELDDNNFVNSKSTEELFSLDIDGEKEVNDRIENIELEAVKNDAKFKIAKLYYEVKNDLTSALKKAEEISNPAEQSRCLIHLATAVLKNEKDIELADKIISKIEEGGLDEVQKSYLKYYNEEKEKLLAN